MLWREMDSVRYYIALFLVAVMPGVFLYWFSVHPWVRFWRKVGPYLTTGIHVGLIVVLAAGVILIREPLLSVEFGTNLGLILLAVPVYLLAAVVRFQQSRRLGSRILLGFPELAPATYGSKLVTEGIYSRLRHPRYVQILLALLAYALFCNYLAVYVVLLAGLVWIVLVARVEEKELRDRFGAEYESYCARVPRFVPLYRGWNLAWKKRR